MKIIIYFLLSFSLFAAKNYNTNLNNNNVNTNNIDYKKGKDSFIFIPGYSYSSGVGSNVSGTFLYYDKKYSSSFPNSFKTKVNYGSNKQFSFSFSHSRYFFNQNYQLSVYFTTGRYARSIYFPMGASSSKDSSEDYTSSDNNFSIDFRVKKYKGFYFGPTYTFAHYKITKSEKDGVLDNHEINGSKNTIASGLGLIISKEKRENSYYPTYGYYISLNNYIYPQVLGASTPYDSMAFNFKTFHPIYNKIIFAFQIYARAVFGDAPFQKMSQLGSDSLLRGYSSYKYVDRRFFGSQFEIRFPIFWRLAGTVFAGTSQVANSVLNYFDTPWKYSAGFGFRFRLDPKDNINFRLDFAYNQDGDMYMYITTLEAF